MVKEIAQAVDFRYHFSINVSRPIREEDFDKFKDLVNKIWSARRRKELFELFPPRIRHNCLSLDSDKISVMITLVLYLIKRRLLF